MFDVYNKLVHFYRLHGERLCLQVYYKVSPPLPSVLPWLSMMAIDPQDYQLTCYR